MCSTDNFYPGRVLVRERGAFLLLKKLSLGKPTLSGNKASTLAGAGRDHGAHFGGEARPEDGHGGPGLPSPPDKK